MFHNSFTMKINNKHIGLNNSVLGFGIIFPSGPLREALEPQSFRGFFFDDSRFGTVIEMFYNVV